MEKMAFLSMPNSAFMIHKFPKQYSLCQFSKNFFYYYNILINMKEDVVLNLSTFQ